MRCPSGQTDPLRVLSPDGRSFCTNFYPEVRIVLGLARQGKVGKREDVWLPYVAHLRRVPNVAALVSHAE